MKEKNLTSSLVITRNLIWKLKLKYFMIGWEEIRKIISTKKVFEHDFHQKLELLDFNLDQFY